MEFENQPEPYKPAGLTRQEVGEALDAERAGKLETILGQRAKTYGRFADNAWIAQQIKAAISSGPNWALLSVSQKESLHQMASKIGRLMTGDPNYLDSWKDIAGYATLICNEISGEANG